MNIPFPLRTGVPVSVVVVLCALPNGGYSQEEPTAPKYPAYSVVRYKEDWSGLANVDRSATGDIFDPIKYVPVTEDGSVYFSIGGQIRSRVEDFRNFGFAEVNDDTYWLNRFRLHADLHATDYFRAFVEGKSAFSTERVLPGGKRTLDVDELALQNAFADFMLPDPETGKAIVTIRPGRQELVFGKQRLVSPLDWSNTRRTWDGISGALNIAEWNISPFWTQFAPVQKYDFNSSKQSIQFFGIYATGKIPWTTFLGDLYWLGLGRDNAAFNGTAGREDRQTLGGRISGKVGETGLDAEVEGAYQFGEVGSGDVDAFMVASQLGYTLPVKKDLVGKPRLFVGFDYASGDDSAGGDVNTFNQLFPLGHAYLGYIDVIGRQNVIDASAGISLKPLAMIKEDKLAMSLHFHYFWRATDKDALYNAGGGVVRPGGAGSSLDLGTEIDLVLKYPVSRHMAVMGGYSHFFAGDFIDQSGPDEDIDFVYLQAALTF